MAKCCISGEDFINFVFSPCIGLLVGPDVEELCSKENLGFVEMLKPFSQISRDVTCRDSSNLVHTVRNLRLNFVDIAKPLPFSCITETELSDVVRVCSRYTSLRSTNVSDGTRSVIVPTTLPWFDAWRYLLLTKMSLNEHEFLKHNLACIFVLTTSHPNIVLGFTELTHKHTNQQHCSPDSYPLWFTENILKFYLLLHDASQVSQTRADELYSQVKSTFGASNCYMLTIFSAKPTVTSSDSSIVTEDNLTNGTVTDAKQLSLNEIQSDPWLSHLLPHGFKLPSIDVQTLQQLGTIVPNLNDVKVETLFVDSSCNAPLRMLNYTDTTTKIATFNLLDPHLGDSNQSNCGSNMSVNHHDHASFLPSNYSRPHGQRLTQTDRDRIHMFVYEFSVRALLPWVEKTMRGLNDQIAHRMRLSRSFFTATKKFFSQAVGTGAAIAMNASMSNAIQNKPTMSTTRSFANSSNPDPPPNSPTNVDQPLNHMQNSGNETHMTRAMSPIELTDNTATKTMYSKDAPELQMRRLADLAFLFQQYEVAYQTYNVLKRDYHNDSAWVHYAGAQEMSALAVYLQGTTSQRQYPYHSVDTAIATYLQHAPSTQLALRATLLNVEALRSRGLYSEAVATLTRMTECNDLTSGLLMEQMAHCALHMRRPMLRKFAFRMVLAAYHFKLAKQPHLAIRSYKIAMQVVISHGWSLIEDHLYYNLGKQAYATGDLLSASRMLSKTLNPSSRQTVERQLLFSREYLSVLTHLLNANPTVFNCDDGLLPEFPLAVINIREVKLLAGKLAHPSLHTNGDEARGVQFSDDEDDAYDTNDSDSPIEQYYNSVTDAQPRYSRLNSILVNRFPDWMEGTDAHESDTSLDECENHSTNTDGDRPTDTVFTLPDCTSHRETKIKLNSKLERLLLLDKFTTTNNMPSNLQRQSWRLPVRLVAAKSYRSRDLEVPVGDDLTIYLPMNNPMRIPLTFTNVHLLWKFIPNPIAHLCTHCGTDDNHLHQQQTDTMPTSLPIANPISNEAVCANDSGSDVQRFVSTQIIDEFILPPGEQKVLQLSVLAKQLGELTVTGLAFDWNHVTPPQYTNMNSVVDPYLSNNNNVIQCAHTNVQHHHEFTTGNTIMPNTTLPDAISMSANSNFSTKCMQIKQSSDPICPIEETPPNSTTLSTVESYKVKGKISFIKSESGTDQCVSKARLPFQWRVIQPVPTLKVFFKSFPTQLYEGQLYPVPLTLTNCGSHPIAQIRLACVWPGLCAFGSLAHLTDRDNQQIWLSVPKPWINVPTTTDSVLAPGGTVSPLLWLRCPYLLTLPPDRKQRRRKLKQRPPVVDSATITAATFYNLNPVAQQRTLYMMFQYEAVQCHTTEPQNSPVNSCRFVRHRCGLEVKPSLQLDALAHPLQLTSLTDLVINVRIKNVVNSIANVSFDITQITCISPRWLIVPMENETHSNSNSATKPPSYVIAPNETISLYLKATVVEPTTTAKPPPVTTDSGMTDICHLFQNMVSTIRLGKPKQQSPPVYPKCPFMLPNELLHSCNAPVATPTVDRQIEVWSPQLEFFSRSGLNWCTHQRPSKLRDKVGQHSNHLLDINLIITWRILSAVDQFSNSPTGHHMTANWGQSHLRINHPNRSVQIPNNIVIDNSQFLFESAKTRSELTNQHSDNGTSIPSHLSTLIRLKLEFPKSVRLSYKTPAETSTTGICSTIPDPSNSLSIESLFSSRPDVKQMSVVTDSVVIPIYARIRNCSQWPVVVRIKLHNTSKLNNELEAPPHESQPTHITPVDTAPSTDFVNYPAKSSGGVSPLLWIGISQNRFELTPNETVRIDLQACVYRPGVYNACTLTVQAAYANTGQADQKELDFIDQITHPQNGLSLIFVEAN